jgi:hypothetical protein
MTNPYSRAVIHQHQQQQQLKVLKSSARGPNIRCFYVTLVTTATIKQNRLKKKYFNTLRFYQGF